MGLRIPIIHILPNSCTITVNILYYNTKNMMSIENWNSNWNTLRKKHIITSTNISKNLPGSGSLSYTTPTLQRSAELASKDGASSWLTPIPLNQYGFTLHKKKHFMMPSACAMAGLHHTQPRFVSAVAKHSPLVTHCHAASMSRKHTELMSSGSEKVI